MVYWFSGMRKKDSFNGLVVWGKLIGLTVYWFSGMGQMDWFNGLLV